MVPAGTAVIDGEVLAFGEADTLAAPTHADIRLTNASGKTPAFLFIVDDAPLQRKLGFYEESVDPVESGSNRAAIRA